MNKYLRTVVAQSEGGTVISDLGHLLSLHLPHCGRGQWHPSDFISQFLKLKKVVSCLLLIGKALAGLYAFQEAMQASAWPFNSCWKCVEEQNLAKWGFPDKWVEAGSLPWLNVRAGVIYHYTSEMFNKKVILCLLQYLLLYNNSSASDSSIFPGFT